jgi:chromosome segregation ATPase
LERELTHLANQFVFKENKHQKKDGQIHLLKETLLGEKEKKEQRNINLRKEVFQRDQEIDDLREQLGSAQESLRAAKQAIQEKVAYLNYTRNELAVFKKQHGMNEEAAKSGSSKSWISDEELIELRGILEIYKDKLVEETQTAQKKTADITALEKQLTLLENQLNEKDEALVKTQRDIHDLEGQLTDMKEELLRLKEGSKDNGFRNNNVDSQGQELQSKFRDINNFLLENLLGSDRIKAHPVVQ